MKNNKNNPISFHLEEEMVENEFNRIQNKQIYNKKLTYSEKVFMNIILEFLKQDL